MLNVCHGLYLYWVWCWYITRAVFVFERGVTDTLTVTDATGCPTHVSATAGVDSNDNHIRHTRTYWRSVKCANLSPLTDRHQNMHTVGHGHLPFCTFFPILIISFFSTFSWFLHISMFTRIFPPSALSITHSQDTQTNFATEYVEMFGASMCFRS